MKRFFRSLVLVLMATGSCLSAFAHDYIKVSNAQGEATYYALADKPEVKFTAEGWLLTTTKTSIQLPLNEIRTLEFANAPTSISTLESPRATVFTIDNGVSVQGIAPESSISIYDLGGKLVSRATADANGNASASLNGQTGFFVVKTNTKTFKICIR